MASDDLSRATLPSHMNYDSIEQSNVAITSADPTRHLRDGAEQRKGRILGNSMSTPTDHCYKFIENSEVSKFIKTLCDGGSEGVLMCIGVVCGAAGAQLTTRRILVLGFSGLVSLSIGVGINEFLSFRAQNLYLLSEYATRKARLLSHRDAEVDACADALMAKGVDAADAALVVRTLARYSDFFLEDVVLPQRSQTLMLAGPAELLESGPLVKEAFATFLAVLSIGALPLLGSVAAYNNLQDREKMAFIVFYVMSGAILFALGALKSCFYGVRWYAAGFHTLLVGLACGLAGWATGASVSFFMPGP